MIEKYFYDVTWDFNQLNGVIEYKPVLSFVCSWAQEWILGKANKAVVSWPPFFRYVADPTLRLSRIVFALFCLKADEPLWSRKLWSKSYVFQNKAKICAKGVPFNNFNVKTKNNVKLNSFKQFTMW